MGEALNAAGPVKARVADAASVEDEMLREAALACPTGAIVVEEVEELLPWHAKVAPGRVEETFDQLG